MLTILPVGYIVQILRILIEKLSFHTKRVAAGPQDFAT